MSAVDDPFAVDAPPGAQRDDGGDGGGDQDGGDAASSSPGGEGFEGEWWGLRNTAPPITPAEVGTQLDVGAAWYQHLGAGFIKQSSSSGAEAWMHYVMAAFLLVAEIAGLEFPGSEGEAGEGEESSSGESEEGGVPESDVAVMGEDWMS